MLVLVISRVNIPITTSNSAHIVSSPMDTNMASETVIPSDMPRIVSLRFSHRCVKSRPTQLPSMQCANAIMGNGQTFRNASEFCDAVYFMLVARWF